VTSLFLNLDEKVEPRGDKTIFRKKKLKEWKLQISKCIINYSN
jgi:hypothetical protein